MQYKLENLYVLISADGRSNPKSTTNQNMAKCVTVMWSEANDWVRLENPCKEESENPTEKPFPKVEQGYCAHESWRANEKTRGKSMQIFIEECFR